MDEHLSYVPGAEQTAPKPQHRSPLRVMECVMHALFLLCGLIAIAFVLFISFYLILSGLPAIRTIGLTEFLFGQTWASTAAEPQFGILPFILTSIYGTAGAILLGVPVGFLTAVFLAKVAPRKVAAVVRPAIDLLADGAKTGLAVKANFRPKMTKQEYLTVWGGMKE